MESRDEQGAVPQAVIRHEPSAQSVSATLTANSAVVEPKDDIEADVHAARIHAVRFWLTFVALTLSTFLSAIDTTSVSTALPTITRSLRQTQPVVDEVDGDGLAANPLLSWVGSAFALGATAVLPLSGKLAEKFGRRPVLMWALVVFAAGSALCGAAPNATVLIIGRVVQGAGSAAIQVLCTIVVSDLVSLRERGLFQWVMGATWSIAAAIGPCLGGVFSQDVSWRWLFYLNLPLCGVALIAVFLFLDQRMPTGSFSSKLLHMDWLGNALITASATSCMIAISWAGVLYSWNDFHVLVPLCLGVAGFGAFIVVEKFAPEPTIPFNILLNRTSAAAYFSAFIHYIVLINAAYFIPLYVQAVRWRSPLRAGIDILPLATCISPAGIIIGILVTKFGKYVLFNVLGFSLIIIGAGLFSSLNAKTAWALLYVYEIISATGYGIVESAGMPAVLAPLSNKSEQTVPAQVFLLFIRTMAQTWGLTIGSAILQNRLRDFANPGLPPLGPSTIPDMTKLTPGARLEVQTAYADSLTLLWQIMTGISGAGLLVLVFMRDIPLHTTVDERHDLETRNSIVRPIGSMSNFNSPATLTMALPSPEGRVYSGRSRTVPLPPEPMERHWPEDAGAEEEGLPYALFDGVVDPPVSSARAIPFASVVEEDMHYPGGTLHLTIEPPAEERALVR